MTQLANRNEVLTTLNSYIPDSHKHLLLVQLYARTNTYYLYGAFDNTQGFWTLKAPDHDQPDMVVVVKPDQYKEWVGEGADRKLQLQDIREFLKVRIANTITHIDEQIAQGIKPRKLPFYTLEQAKLLPNLQEHKFDADTFDNYDLILLNYQTSCNGSQCTQCGHLFDCTDYDSYYEYHSCINCDNYYRIN